MRPSWCSDQSTVLSVYNATRHDTVTTVVAGVQGTMDQAAVRLTAAAGLLRLARSHDDAVPVALFHRIALTLQVQHASLLAMHVSRTP